MKQVQLSVIFTIIEALLSSTCGYQIPNQHVVNSLVINGEPTNELADISKSEFFQQVYKICPQCLSHQECLCNGFHLHIKPINEPTAKDLRESINLMINQNKQHYQTEEPTSILQRNQKMLQQHLSQLKLQQQAFTVTPATTMPITTPITKPKTTSNATAQQPIDKLPTTTVQTPFPKIENSPASCLDPPFQYGHCSEPIVAWSFDINGHIECRNFTYSGCGLSTNIFWTVEDCTNKCQGVTARKEVQSFPSMQKISSSEEEDDDGMADRKNFHIHLMRQQNPFLQSFLRRKKLFLAKNLSKKSTTFFLHHYHN